jgi:hypothetical protein
MEWGSTQEFLDSCTKWFSAKSTVSMRVHPREELQHVVEGATVIRASEPFKPRERNGSIRHTVTIREGQFWMIYDSLTGIVSLGEMHDPVGVSWIEARDRRLIIEDLDTANSLR